MYTKRKETKVIVVHHSASPPDTTFEQIKRWHTSPPPEGRGWDNIGYHYVILRDGEIVPGRAEDEMGTQVANFNDKSLGICLTGDFRLNEPTIEQIHSLTDLLTTLVVKYKLKYWNIRGHRDIKILFIFNTTMTECPGKNLYDLLPDIRRAVGKRLRQI